MKNTWLASFTLIFTISILFTSGTAQYASAAVSPIFDFEFGTLGSGDIEFDEVRGVEVDSSNGHIIVADRDNSRIQVFNAAGNVLLFEFDGSVGADCSAFDEPKAVALDGAGNIYVADAAVSGDPFGLIQKFDSTGTCLDSFTVDSPRGVAVLSSGNIVVIDAWDQEELDVYNAAGTFLFSFDGTLGGGDLFDKPKGIAVDGSDKIYVADTFNHQVQIFDSAGSFLSSFGTQGSGDGEFEFPVGIAVGSTGIIYVADEGNDRIQLFDSSGNFLAEIGSDGSGDAEFDQLRDVAVDTSGRFYVADDGRFNSPDNNRIQVFDTNDDVIIGGEIIPIDQTALLLAGVQSVSMWMIPVVVSGAGIGVFVIMRSRK